MTAQTEERQLTDAELKKLKDDLWHSADMLRASAHLAANKYGQPILGLIFLRYADILFKQHRAEIEAEYERVKGSRAEKSKKQVSIEKCGFFLPECAYYDTINNAPDDANKALLVKNAMLAIEQENDKMDGVLPKDVYGQLVPEEEPELLSKIVRIFKDIPENISVDIFGEIYEYFLGNFAMQEGKDGGTFYTPATVVRYMVEALRPETGNKLLLDPACGSGGMFVQAARYMHRHNRGADMMNFMCCGVEKEPDTVKLAKMNLLLNNVRGDIVEANSFYSDPHNAVGRFDYVMANPPFNVDEVVYEKVKDDPRFNTYGVPKNKSGGGKKSSDKKETVPNANYLWISFFASALNENGRAALVMANSASDAGGSELAIRKKMIEEGIISQMVTLPSNMFSSVTLPATLWFFDKHKTKTEKRDEILFIDARNTFTQVDRAHRKFSDEQIKNLGVITRMYNGDELAFDNLINEYKHKAEILLNDYNEKQRAACDCCEALRAAVQKLTPRLLPAEDGVDTDMLSIHFCSQFGSTNEMITHINDETELKTVIDDINYNTTFIADYCKFLDGVVRADKKTKGLLPNVKAIGELITDASEFASGVVSMIENIMWLRERFPDGKYRDVIGLCKAAKLDGEDGVIEQDYSLNAGRYVGVVIEDDGMTEQEFKEKMLSLSSEYAALSKETAELERQIAENMKGLFGV